MRAITDTAWRDFRRTWPQLLLTDVAYKLLAFLVLTPLAALLLRTFLSLSGTTVLADEDILFFFLTPLGWLTLIVLGGALIAIVALEQAGLMAIALGAIHDRRVEYRQALLHTARRAVAVFRLTAYLVARTVLLVAPFLIAAGLVYLWLLTEFDINYYLTEHPPEFWLAAILIAIVVGTMIVVLARFLINWVFTLPLVLFEGVGERESFQLSRERVDPHRRIVTRWLVGWAASALFLSIAGSGLVAGLGRLIVPRLVDRTALLAFGIGGLMLLWGILHLLVSLVGAAGFSLLTIHLYRAYGGGDVDLDIDSGPLGESAELGIRRRSLVWGFVALAVVAVGAGTVFLNSFSVEQEIAVTAHRGAAGAAPENTLASIERAIADGTDWVEIDVQETADGEVVVMHDSDLMKLAGVNLKIWDATLADLEAIDIGSWFAPDFADQRVPTLAQVLDLCKGRARVNIELKYYGHDVRLEERVVEIVESAEMAADVRVMSLKIDGVRKLQALRPEWETGLLTAVAVGDLTTVDVDFLAVSAGIVTRRFVRAAHRSGKEVHAWTVNDVAGMSLMIGRGVDNLITDEPALAHRVRTDRRAMSAAERLLVDLAPLFGAEPDYPDPAEDLDG